MSDRALYPPIIALLRALDDLDQSSSWDQSVQAIEAILDGLATTQAHSDGTVNAVAVMSEVQALWLLTEEILLAAKKLRSETSQPTAIIPRAVMTSSSTSTMTANQSTMADLPTLPAQSTESGKCHDAKYRSLKAEGLRRQWEIVRDRFLLCVRFFVFANGFLHILRPVEQQLIRPSTEEQILPTSIHFPQQDLRMLREDAKNLICELAKLWKDSE